MVQLYNDFNPLVDRDRKNFGVRYQDVFLAYIVSTLVKEKQDALARALATPGSDGYTYGIDISHWNTVNDWSALYNAGYIYVILKATEGTSFIDSKFVEHWNEAVSAGMMVMVYHFFRSNYKGADQANFFYNTILPFLDAVDRKTLAWMDVETSDGVSIDARRNRLEGALITIRQLLSVPGVYSSPSLWQQLIGLVSWINGYYQWDAHWTSADTPALPIGWSWEKTKLWQYGHSGYSWVAQPPGTSGNIDVNRFYGTPADLKKLLGYEDTTPPPPSGDCTCQVEIAGLTTDITELFNIANTLNNKLDSFGVSLDTLEGAVTELQSEIVVVRNQLVTVEGKADTALALANEALDIANGIGSHYHVATVGGPIFDNTSNPPAPAPVDPIEPVPAPVEPTPDPVEPAPADPIDDYSQFQKYEVVDDKALAWIKESVKSMGPPPVYFMDIYGGSDVSKRIRYDKGEKLYCDINMKIKADGGKTFILYKAGEHGENPPPKGYYLFIDQADVQKIS